MFSYKQNMDVTKSSLSECVSNPKLSSNVHTADSWQSRLAFEMDKLSELRRQVAAQEERFHLMQQQFDKLTSDAPGSKYSLVDFFSVCIFWK